MVVLLGDSSTLPGSARQDLPRNLEMCARIEEAEVVYPFRFVVAGDSGAWPDPTAEGIFSQLVAQVAEIDRAPLFFANLGDFAGPGTLDRHERYLDLVAPLPMPNICVLGNHDVDHEDGADVFERVHGPANFEFAYGNTRFFVLRSVPGIVGQVEIPSSGPLSGAGPRREDLSFLAEALERTEEPNRVVLMHMPPHLDGHFAPHEDWGFTKHEREFLDVIQSGNVKLVCCAHGLAFDTVVRDGIRFVMSGGGGSGLCSHYRGICAQGPGHPEDRGALFHAVEITIDGSGRVSARVLQAFAPKGTFRFSFG